VCPAVGALFLPVGGSLPPRRWAVAFALGLAATQFWGTRVLVPLPSATLGVLLDFSHCRGFSRVDRSSRVHLRSPWLTRLAAISAWDSSFGSGRSLSRLCALGRLFEGLRTLTERLPRQRPPSQSCRQLPNFSLSGCRQPPFEICSRAPLWRTTLLPLKWRSFFVRSRVRGPRSACGVAATR
jgi:hypothetical protein